MTDEQKEPEYVPLEQDPVQSKPDNMTPEYIGLVENGISNIEAGGVCYSRLYTKGGTEINITARAVDPITSLQLMMETLAYGVKEYGLTNHVIHQSPAMPAQAQARVSAPVAPAVQNQVIPQASVPQQSGKVLEVVALRKTFNKGGTSTYFRAHTKDAAYARYGIAAYPESFPPDFNQNVQDTYPPEQQLQPPASMRYVEVSADGKKSVRFMANP